MQGAFPFRFHPKSKYDINLRVVTVLLFENSTAQLRSNGDPERPKCSNSNYCIYIHTQCPTLGRI